MGVIDKNRKQTLDEVADTLMKQPRKAATLDDVVSEQLKKKDLDGVSATGSASVVVGGIPGSSSAQSAERIPNEATRIPFSTSQDDGDAVLKGLSVFGSKPKEVGPLLTSDNPDGIIEYNKNFETNIGLPSLDLGSDLPQIKRQKEQEKYLKYRDLESKINSAISSIEGVDATMKDFQTLRQESPKVFEKVKQQLGIQATPEQAEGEQFKEDNYVFDVFKGYEEKATQAKLEEGRRRRAVISESINNDLADASKFTGKEYATPKNLEEAKQIINDINGKKFQLATAFEFGRKGGVTFDDTISGVLEDAEAVKKEIAAGEKVMPALTNLVSGYVFEQKSKANPNVSPFEVGKEIFKITNPQEYELYEQMGGDESYGRIGSRSETPKYADAFNRRITELGINAFQTFGNKSSIESADVARKSLGWKYTYPVEEQAKHMIAAKLKEKGVPIKNAPAELVDEIASELPEVYKNVWFEKNKPENNTTLPTTGFWSSAKGSYYNTVEDATKSLLGWMMPERSRERALDIAKRRTSSDVLGENPESVQRLNALKEKEKQQPLSETEIAEKKELEKFTNIRTGWERFKDLSGTGVGQFAGFGTISAFTGGLGNAKNVGGALKSVISPMAGRDGMLAAGYLMSLEGNMRDAVEMFPGKTDGIKRFVYGNVASTIDTYVERLFPEEKFLSGLFKGDLKRLIPNLTEKNLRKELNEGLAGKIARTVTKKIAAQQGTPIQEGFEEGLALYLKDTFKSTLDPEYDTQPVTMNEILNTATQAYLSSQLLGVPKGIFAQKNSYVPLNAIWDAASDNDTYSDVKLKILELKQKGDLTDDQANERISLLNTARKNWEDNPILSGGMGNLSLPKKQNYLGRLMNEAVLQKKADAATDENVKSTINKEISESKKARKAIFDGDSFVTPDNKEVDIKELTPEQVILQQAEEGKLGAYTEMVKQNPKLAKDVLADYAKQKYGVSDEGTDLDGGGRVLPSKEIDEAVTRAFPDKESVVADIKGTISTSKINQASKEIGESISPILKRVNDADYINENELDESANKLYDLMDEVEKSDMTDEQKQSSLNLIEPIINKLEGYEFRTKTEGGTTTETKATVVPRENVPKKIVPALEQSAGTEVEVTIPGGDKRTGTLSIKGGNYVIDVPKGQQIVLGEKAITDRDLTLPDSEEVESPIQFDEDGNVSSVTLKTKSGNLVTIKDSDKALDLAIQIRADMIGEVTPQEFDIVYEEIQKPFTKEVLVADQNKDAGEKVTNETTKEDIKGNQPKRTDKEHATYIKDKFVEEFTKKGVSKEQALAAVALMEARAKASGLGDNWYRQIEDIGNGEFQSDDILYQFIPQKLKKAAKWTALLAGVWNLNAKIANKVFQYKNDKNTTEFISQMASEYGYVYVDKDGNIIKHPDGVKQDDNIKKYLDSVWAKAGYPKIEISKNGWRPKYNGLTNTITIYIDIKHPGYAIPDLNERNEVIAYGIPPSILFAEISHALQAADGKMSVGRMVTDFIKSGFSKEKSYETIGTIENEAHSVIEKKLMDRYLNIIESQKKINEPSDGEIKSITKFVNDYYSINNEKAPKEVIERAIELWEKFGNPEILPDSTNENERAYASQGENGSPAKLGNITDLDDFISEISHAAQYNSGAELSEGKYKNQKEYDEKEYNRKGSAEYDAHKLIEPLLANYIFSGKKGEELVNYTMYNIADSVKNELKAAIKKYNIKFQNTKGAVETLASGRKIIHALDAPDFSTAVHELAHIFEDELIDTDRKIVQDWAGTEEWNRETSETFARGFERYLRDGNAPTKELKSLFDKFKQWLTDIYQSLKASPIEKKVSPQVRKIFDSLLSEQKSQSLSKEQPQVEREKAGAEKSEVFDAIEKAERSKKSQKAKSEATAKAAIEFGIDGLRALEIHRNFDEIVKQLKSSNKLKVKC